MAQPPPTVDPINSILSGFGTRLTETEERQRLIKERLLLIGNNLIETKEEQQNEHFVIKNKLKVIEEDLKYLKQQNQRIISELSNLARKSELEILERQWEMFQLPDLVKIKNKRN